MLSTQKYDLLNDGIKKRGIDSQPKAEMSILEMKTKRMGKSNFERMMELATEVFDARHDPHQLDVDEHLIERLQRLHPSTLSEYDDGNGPVVWILLIPTTSELMHQFLEGHIHEKELLDLTPLDAPLDAIYLCSGLVLPEYRRKGIAKKLTLAAIAEMQKKFPIRYLFAWAFTEEGKLGAESVARETGLSLYFK